MIWSYIEVFTKVRGQQKTLADDSVDKLNRSFTVVVLLIAAIFIASKSFGVQITCLDSGMKLTSVQMDYVNSVCWVQDLKVLDYFYNDAIENKNKLVNTNSYPWIPLIAILLAFFFYMPYMLWKCIVRKNSYRHVPVDISTVIDLLKKNPIYKKDDFNREVRSAANYLHRCFTLNNYFNEGVIGSCGDDVDGDDNNDEIQWHTRNYPKRLSDRMKPFRKRQPVVTVYVPLALKYLFIKVLYLLVSVLVFFLSDYLFQFQRPFYHFGLDMLEKYSTKNATRNEYLASRYWPTNILCEIKTRADFKNMVTNQFHCSLPANVFNEKIFLILWCWLVLLAALNVCSLVNWLIRLTFRRAIVRGWLAWPYKQSCYSKKHVKAFVYEYLSGEGFLVLMLIKSNTQDWCVRNLVKELWKRYTASVCPDSNVSTTSENRHGTPMGNEFHLLSTATKPNRREMMLNPRYENTANTGSGGNALVSLTTPRKVNNDNSESSSECKNNYKLSDEL